MHKNITWPFVLFHWSVLLFKKWARLRMLAKWVLKGITGSKMEECHIYVDGIS
jgi:hypothetical protein